MTNTKRLMARIDDAIAQVSYLIDYVPLSEPTPLQVIESAVADLEAQHRNEIQRQREYRQSEVAQLEHQLKQSSLANSMLRDNVASILRPGTGRHRA